MLLGDSQTPSDVDIDQHMIAIVPKKFHYVNGRYRTGCWDDVMELGCQSHWPPQLSTS